MSDQKHENVGEPRLRPAETMKANTGNGKLPGTKERKSGHCELQRTVWKSTVDIQFGQTRETNEKKRGKEGEGGGRKKEERNGRARPRQLRATYVRACARARVRSPILPKTTDFGTDIDSRRRYRHMPGFSGCPTSGNGDGNRLRPEIISSLLSLTSRRPFSRESAARHGYRVCLTGRIRSIM